jgi:hypothetical protein
MRRTRPRAALPGLAALGLLAAACGGGHTASVTPQDQECAAVVQEANAIPLLEASKASAADVTRAQLAASGLTTAAANATGAVAGPGSQLASAARAYADALAGHQNEAANTAGGLLRQRAQAVATVCKATVLGVAPPGPTS